MMGLSGGERISMIRLAVLIRSTRVADRRNCRGIYALMLSRVRIESTQSNLSDVLIYSAVYDSNKYNVL